MVHRTSPGKSNTPKELSWVLAILFSLGWLLLFYSLVLGWQTLSHLLNVDQVFSSRSLTSFGYWFSGIAQAFATFLLFILFRTTGFWDFSESPYIANLRREFKTIFVCVCIGLGLQFSLSELGNLLRYAVPIHFEQIKHIHHMMNATEGWGQVGVGFSVVLIAPLTEELWFRGFILRALKNRYRAGLALLLSSTLFGLAHLEPLMMITAGLAGLFAGMIFLRTGSLWPCLALHMSINGSAFILTERTVRIVGFNTLNPQIEHISPWLWVPGLVVTLAGMGWIVTKSPTREF